MRRFSCKQKVLYLCVFIGCLGTLVQPVSYARSDYNKHKLDFYSVLGISSERGGMLEPLFRELHDTIDQKGGNSEFIRELKNKFGLKFGGGTKHRYIFHWGFNIDLKYHKPLMDSLEEEFMEQGLEGDELDENIEEALDFINEERARQNRKLIQRCGEITGLPRDMSAGLITILWDIHILSDYLDKEKEGLLSFPKLSSDLRSKGLERLFEQDCRNSDFGQRFKQVVNQLDNIYRTYNSEKGWACEYLNFLCGYDDCNNQILNGKGALADLLRNSKVVRGILSKKGIEL